MSVTQQSLCPVHDGRSARPNAPALCVEYNDNSCCTSDAHYRAVEAQQQEFRDAFANAECRAQFDVLSCGLSCSPEQALFFEPNTNTTGEATFAVCGEFCARWYGACRDEPLDGGTVGALFPTAAAFCQSAVQDERFALLIRDERCFDGAEPPKACRNSYAEGDGLYNYLTGEPPSEVRVDDTNTFTVQAVDLYQNLKLVDNEGYDVQFSVPGVMRSATASDGLTTVTWSTTVAGTLMLSVTCADGEHIEHSPFPVVVRPGPYETAELDCPVQEVANDLVLVDVWALDRHGNRLDRSPGNAANLRVEVNGPNGFVARPELADNCDGSFTAAFTPPLAGNYRVL